MMIVTDARMGPPVVFARRYCAGPRDPNLTRPAANPNTLCNDRALSSAERAPRRDELRHRILPGAVRERTLAGPVGVHDEDRRIGLECVVVERGLVPPSIHAAVPQD